MDARRQFGQNVRRERERLNLTQERLAHEASIHPTQISYIESGSRSPRFDTIVAIANALSVDPGRLFDGVK